jgi:hypothetical protein
MERRRTSAWQNLMGTIVQRTNKTLAPASPPSLQAPRGDVERQTEWEYLTYLVVNGRDAFSDSGQDGASSPHARPLRDVLKQAGADQWELAAIDVGARFAIGSHGHEGSIYIFKRPRWRSR